MKKKISNIKFLFKNKEVKVLIENFLSLSLLQVVGYILPLITLPYIARVIGVENFGSIAFASAVIVFFQTLTDYGFNYTGIRDISRIRDNKIETSLAFSRIIFARVFLLVLSFIILLLLILLVPKFKENEVILLYTFTLIPGYVMYPEWFFQALEKMKYSSILSVIIKILFTCSIFIFIRDKEDYIYIPLINGLGFMFVGIMAFILIYKQGYKLVRVSIKEIAEVIKNSTNMFVTLILPNLYTNMSTIFIELFWGKGATGIFDAGYKFIGITQQFTNVLSRAFYPFLARRMDKHSLYEKISFVLSLVISAILYFSAPLIVKYFYTEEFSDAVIVLRILAISPLFLFMMNAYGTNYLVLKGKERLLRNIVIICSLIGLLITYYFTLNFSYKGAAFSITLVWCIRGLLTWKYANNLKKQI